MTRIEATAMAQLRHLYTNLKNGGVRDTAQAKRIADSLLGPVIETLEMAQPAPAAMAGPVAVLKFERGTPGRENEMPRVVSCNWMPDGEYEVYLAAAPTTQPAPKQEAQEPATVPRFNCWSTNEGDSWFDHPADSQAIYDCLGSDAKVGDEYELTAGWESVTARYRITEVVGDGEEYEVECISHPRENTAPQPSTANGADLWRCTVCGRIGTVGRCCGEDTRAAQEGKK